MHPMKRKVVIGLLALGTVLGYGAGFASLRHGKHGCSRKAAFERHEAALCEGAAERTNARPPRGGAREAACDATSATLQTQ